MNLSRANVVLGVVAAVLVVPTWLQLRSEREVFTDIARIPLLFDGFTPDNVGVIVLGQPKKDQPPPDPQNPEQKKVVHDQLAFQRNDKGGFQIAMMGSERTGVPIDKNRVENDVFMHLRAIRADRDTMVQPNATPQQLESFGLDDAHAFVIKVSDKTGQNVIAELLVGRDVGAQGGTDALRGTYVRKRDSNDVILYENDRPWRRDVQEDQWIDRMLVRIEPDKVRRLAIRNAATAGTTFTFERPDGKASWQCKDAPADVGAVRQSEVEAFVARLRFLSVQDYRVPLQRVGNRAQLGLEPPQIEVAITVREGDQDRVVTLAVGGKVEGKNEYYLQSSESTFLLTWPAGFVTQFELDVKKQIFDPKGPPAPQAPTNPPPDKK